MCTFSIIIPTYNSAGTIACCIESILKQWLTGYEILVIDGLSTDNTVEIVNQFASTSPITVVSEKDKGIYDAMNKGIDIAKGDWLYFLGSDDLIYDEYVLNRVKTQIKNAPDAKLVYGDVITSDGTREGYSEYTYDKLLSRCICHQSIFYHHSLFNGIRYDLQYKVCADWDFNLKMFRKKIQPVYMDLVIARFNLGGVSGRWWEHPEYLNNFADKKKMILRYRGLPYLFGYAFRKILKKITG